VTSPASALSASTSTRSSTLKGNTGQRIPELDGLRAVSVSLVLLYHIWSLQYATLVPHIRLLSRVINNCGDLGVKTFFVISGFVICRLLIAEESSYGSVSLKGFYYRRIFRILPPLYFYLCMLALLLSLGAIRERWSAIMSSSLFLCDLNTPSHRSWYVGHTWSLAVEEQFYLIFPPLWILTSKPWKSRIFFGLFFLCTAWNLTVLFTGWNGLLVSRAVEGFACISCGVLMAIHEQRGRRLAASVPAFLAALTALMLFVHLVVSPDWQVQLYEGLIMPPAIGLLLLFSLGSGARLRALLCSPPVQAVGLTSYGIYLWQQFFSAPKEYFAGSGTVVPFLLPLLCVIVPISYILVEQPAMRYGRFLSERARRSGPARLQ